MRISSNMMRYNFLRSLNDSMETQNTLQEQLSDGKSLHRPSDDPVRAVRDLTYKTSQVLNEQYTQNLQDAQSWMENTDGVMSDLSSVMIKVKELVVSADDTKPTDALNTIGAQIDGLINQVVSLGNTKIGDRYLFGGQNDSTQPFVRTTIKDPNSDLTKEVVIYNGDNSRISMPIQAGAVNPTQDSVNLTGTDVFGAEKTIYGQKTLSVLNNLLEIKNELRKTSTVTQTNSAGGTGTVGGKYTGAGYANYDIKIKNADATGHVTSVAYSKDGSEWTDIPVDNATNPTTIPSINIANNPAKIVFADGVTFSIADNTNNKSETADANGTIHADVYSFRVPQDAFDVAQSNASGGAATITGTATNTESIPNSVRIDDIDSSGQVTAASYSSDGGSTWTSLSNYNVTQTNSSGSAATVTGNLTAGPYTVAITGVDENGKITEINGDPAINITYDITTDTDTGKTSSTANIQLATGVVLHIPTNTANKTTDTYTVIAKSNSFITTTGTSTEIKLPSDTTISGLSGLTMTIAANSKNMVNDAYSFDLPQGNGPDVEWLSSVATQYVSDDHNLQLKSQTNLGARMSMYEMAYNMLLNQNTVIQTDIANTEDIDMAKAITDFNTAQNIYRSALAVGGKIMPTSLVDFLS
ncbi:MAG: flagellar hook-associated protein 3 [Firmicutes bacterium]|nr:flagellar hook-associated protein 3 [Bacillota bacterium]